ncbi:hypothetical protein ACLMJK_009565 [Lecanora helva]
MPLQLIYTHHGKSAEHRSQGGEARYGHCYANLNERPEDAKAFQTKLVGSAKTEEKWLREHFYNEDKLSRNER